VAPPCVCTAGVPVDGPSSVSSQRLGGRRNTGDFGPPSVPPVTATKFFVKRTGQTAHFARHHLHSTDININSVIVSSFLSSDMGQPGTVAQIVGWRGFSGRPRCSAGTQNATTSSLSLLILGTSIQLGIFRLDVHFNQSSVDGGKSSLCRNLGRTEGRSNADPRRQFVSQQTVPTVVSATISDGSELHLKSSAGLIARQLAKVSAVPSSRRTGTGRKSGIKEDRKTRRSRAEFQPTSSPVLPKQLHLRVYQPLLASIHSRKASIRPQLRRITSITKLLSPPYALLSHRTHHS